MNEQRALAWGVGAGAAAGVLTAISLPAITCRSNGTVACQEQPNYQAGAIVGLAALLLTAIAVHR